MARRPSVPRVRRFGVVALAALAVIGALGAGASRARAASDPLRSQQWQLASGGPMGGIASGAPSAAERR